MITGTCNEEMKGNA